MGGERGPEGSDTLTVVTALKELLGGPALQCDQPASVRVREAIEQPRRPFISLAGLAPAPRVPERVAEPRVKLDGIELGRPELERAPVECGCARERQGVEGLARRWDDVALDRGEIVRRLEVLE